jgi:ion channel
MAWDLRMSRNGWPLGVGLAAAGFGLSLLFSGHPYAEWGVVATVDFYLVALLLSAARTGRTSIERWPKMPDRDWGLLILLLLFVGLVSAFGGIYIGTGKVVHSPCSVLESSWDSLYFSIVTITTLGYGDYAPSSTYARYAVIAELVSGMLLLILAFPVLVSRLAAFGDSQRSVSAVMDFNGLSVSWLFKVGPVDIVGNTLKWASVSSS